MDMKERLATEIINSGVLQQYVHYNDLRMVAGVIAGYLAGHGGVIIPPVKVGDIVYEISEDHYCDTDACYCCETYEELVESECRHHHIDKSIIEIPFRISMIDKIGKTVFLTREEAEKALEDKNVL